MLMDHFKAHIRKTYPEMMHFLTYADNYAVGYFEKQGFSKDISLDRSVWAGYIKDYEGGTIMQCTMLPKIDYLDKSTIFKQQQEAVLTKIREKSNSHIIYPGLPQFQPGAPLNAVDPKTVPGLSERVLFYVSSRINIIVRGNWLDTRNGSRVSPLHFLHFTALVILLCSLARQPVKNSVKSLMEKLLQELMEEPKGWAFLKPVDTTDVADYFDIIKHPMGT